MTRLIYTLFAILAIACPLSAFAQATSFTTGERLDHFLSVCIDKKDAIEILEAFRSSEREAEALWQTKEKCQNVNVIEAKVGKSVYSVKGAGKTFSAVEIVLDGKVVAYFLTSAPVNKAQNNS